MSGYNLFGKKEEEKAATVKEELLVEAPVDSDFVAVEEQAPVAEKPKKKYTRKTKAKAAEPAPAAQPVDKYTAAKKKLFG